MNYLRNLLAVILALAIFTALGCETANLRCAYKAGAVEKVRYTSDKTYRQWVEMQPGEPAQMSARTTAQEVILRREVQSVTPDGSALMKVTFEKAHVNLDIDMPNKKTSEFYTSTTEQTTASSNWSNEPALVGQSYTIRIAPDSTVQAVMGLDDIRAQLGIQDPQQGLVARLLAEDEIKQAHQRIFLQASPPEVSDGTSYEKMLELPDPLVKAKAIKKTYLIAAARQENDAQLVPIMAAGELIYTLPEGMEEPPAPGDPIKMLIRDNGDIQKFVYTTAALFDLTAGQVRSDNQNFDFSLMLLGEKIFGQRTDNGEKKKDEGAMFIEIQSSRNFEVLP